MGEAQRKALEIAASSRRLRTATELGLTTQEAGALTRRGWLASFQQSEQMRGERRIYYRIYEITPAGRAALQEETSDV